MTERDTRINRKGVAMIVTLLIVMGLAMLASGVILITTSEVYITRNEAYGKEAFYAAEAGLQHARRALRGLSSRDEITAMYQARSGVSDFVYGPTGDQDVWKQLVNTADGAWGARTIDPSTQRRYEVYVVNNDPTEVDNAGRAIEADGLLYVRSVGYSYMNTRKILEEMIFLNAPVVDASKDQFGGGEGNINNPRG